MERADPNRLPLDELFARLVDADRLERLIDLAFEEDLGALGDVTTRHFVDPARRVEVVAAARESGTAAGIAAALRVLARAPDLEVTALLADGASFSAGDALLRIGGSLASILPIERVLLNLLSRMCGVATATRRHVDAIAGTRARLCCTRKTIPGWRDLDKFAVRCGGGHLHRIGLYDAVLVKDNHIGAMAPEDFASRIAEGAEAARAEHALRFVEVEVDRLDQLDRLLALPEGTIDIVLLDNFDLAALGEAVARRDARAPSLELEASGGVRLDTIRAIAETGVDRISCGAITHSARSLDIGLDLLASES
jgi:nicotinate-nucleotide pyrophosphorylase (carboxylating)